MMLIQSAATGESLTHFEAWEGAAPPPYLPLGQQRRRVRAVYVTWKCGYRGVTH
jgi:hypothetical protein